jgi:DNA replication licensing factor MCM5
MSKSQAKATQLVIMCKTCSSKKIINVKPGFGGAELPRVCEYVK